MTIAKANPGWDGDGVQGAGQPRDWRGRWVGLPGASKLNNIMSRKVHNSLFEVVTEVADKNGGKKTKVVRTFKTQKGADAFVEREIATDKTDKKAYRELEASRAKQDEDRRKRIAAEQKKERDRQAEVNRRAAAVQQVAESRDKPSFSRRTKATRVQVSETERHQLPEGVQPNMKAAEDTAKEFVGDASERKYAGLVTRLLGKGITQDPARRGKINDQYGISPKRQAQIESAVYSAAFPESTAAPRQRNLAGGSRNRLGDRQRQAMLDNGAISAVAIPNTGKTEDRLYKANKGKHKGKFVVTNSHGDTRVVSEARAKKLIIDGRKHWEKENAAALEAGRLRSEKYRREQNALKEADETAQEIAREAKINAAKKLARDFGFDEDDTYWWGFFSRDPSLVKDQKDEKTSTPLRVGRPADKQPSRRMKPEDLEGILALPDIDSRDMRGHRPGPKKPVKGDEDFVEATAEQRRTSEDQESLNRERQIRHDRRAEIRAYREYMRKNPKSKMTFETFRKKYRKGTIQKANPLWDGDGVQGVGQPRGAHGRWTETGRRAANAVAGFSKVPGETRNKSGATPSRRAGSRPLKDKGAVKGVFDVRAKRVKDGLKLARPQKGSSHNTRLGDGTPVKRKKHWTPEEAYFLRNNGNTRISDQRLRDIYENRSSITAREFDLLQSATGDARFDGEQLIPFRAVREGGAQRKMERYKMIKNLRTQLAQDFAKEKGKGERGAGGQVRINSGDRARRQNELDSQKRKENDRNKVTRAVKEQMLKDFGDGVRAKCVFCGRPVRIEEVSPERITPGPLGGKYERGNMAPAHVACNEKHGNMAQRNPDAYEEMMLNKLLTRYADNAKAIRMVKAHMRKKGWTF